MEISTLLGGLGLGGVVVTFIKNYLDNKQMLTKRVFEEKRDAYVNYLNISNISQTMPREEALWARTAAFERIKLCGNAEVVRLVEAVGKLPPNSPRDLIEELIQVMRADLYPR